MLMAANASAAPTGTQVPTLNCGVLATAEKPNRSPTKPLAPLVMMLARARPRAPVPVTAKRETRITSMTSDTDAPTVKIVVAPGFKVKPA